MKLVPVALTVAILSLAACSKAPEEPAAPASPEDQFIADVSTALGGQSNIEAVNTVAVEGGGSLQNVGQDMLPESTELKFEISGYRIAADLNARYSRTEQTRTPQFIYFRGPDPITEVFGIAGDVGYVVGTDGSAARAPETTAMDLRSAYYHHPLPLMHAVLSGTATTGNVREEDGARLADITTAEGNVVTLAVDAATATPQFTRSTDHHFYLRDIVRTTRFSNYEAVGGLTLPSQVDVSFDEFSVASLALSGYSINAEIGDLGAPAAAASADPITGSAPANVTAEEVADGVWFLAGQSHHSVLLEFDDHLVVIEAPNEPRILAVLEKAAELVPEKPVTHVVNTHHHFDHSGGIRAAISRSLTIVTHDANADFYRRMSKQPSSIIPDALSRQPRGLKIETFEDKLVRADESMNLELHHIAGNEHSSSMLMAYLPAYGIIIEADAFSPSPARAQLFAPNMLDNIQRLGLEVDTIVPIHGPVGPFEELEAHVQDIRDDE